MRCAADGPEPDTAPSASPVPLAPFREALTDPEIATPDGIAGPGGKRADKRFNVYRNNVAAGLIGALADIYPAVRRLVGDEFFASMAKVYMRREQPSSPLLFRYGTGFAAFLETFEPVSRLFYLPDVARLERAWLDAFHAADAPPLDANALGAIAPEKLVDQRFEAHPAAHVIRSRHAAVSIFSLNRSGEDLSRIDPSEPEDGLVTRRAFDVEVRRLPPGVAVFATALMDGKTLGEAAGEAGGEAADFDLAAAIATMLQAGAFSRLARNDSDGEGS